MREDRIPDSLKKVGFGCLRILGGHQAVFRKFAQIPSRTTLNTLMLLFSQYSGAKLTLEVFTSMLTLTKKSCGMNCRLIGSKKLIEADWKSRVHLVIDPLKGEIP
jgi:hypothetical protein